MILFVDETVPCHPDIAILKGKPGCPREIYYPMINSFFDYIEQRYDDEVVIALHPKTPPEEVAKNNFNRTQYINRTKGLIKDANLVMTHASTAMFLATMYNKPVMFLTCKEFWCNSFAWKILELARAFNTYPIDMRTCRYLYMPDLVYSILYGMSCIRRIFYRDSKLLMNEVPDVV